MNPKQNCWEAVSCGRGPDGPRVVELGECPAATDETSDGINGGANGGRLCWAISGTFCGGVVQGSSAAKRLTCLHCDFFERVLREEGASVSMPTSVVATGYSRLALGASVIAAIWLLIGVLSLTAWAGVVHIAVPIAAGVAIATSLALVYRVRLRGCRYREAFVLAIACEAAGALALSIVESSLLDPALVTPLVSAICVLILVFPLLLPVSPRAALGGAVLAATMGPVGYGIDLALGATVVGEPMSLLARFVPPYACAFLALLTVRMLYRLAGDVKRARRLGSYELVARVGGGGMGEVWRARHRMLARPAAVKLIRPTNGTTERLGDRFEREAQATATLESPHTVQLYDFGVADDGTFYYVMELLQGIDLQALVSRFGPQRPERVVHLLRQACDSLDDAHRIGLIHRDIKPANIFLARKGRRVDFVKVLDFGLVKLKRQEVDLQATADGSLVGTPAFMAPELIVGSAPIDGRANVYALGCVAYWLLTGQLVFEAKSTMTMAVAHATDEPVPPSQRTENPIPEALDDILMACLAKSPAERPDALTLSRMLETVAFDDAWTQETARRWWRKHLPEGIARGDETEATRGPVSTFINPA